MSAHFMKFILSYLVSFFFYPLIGHKQKRTFSSTGMCPILSGKCFHPWAIGKFREADLRLDTPEDAFFEKDGFAAIVPGSTEDSEAWHRIMSDDPEDIMPPPEIKKELTEREKEILTKWIEQGAKWEGHWSYLPCKNRLHPKPATQSGPKTQSITFIHAKLDELGLKPFPRSRPSHPHPPALPRPYRPSSQPC
jgi:hypothetical protein